MGAGPSVAAPKAHRVKKAGTRVQLKGIYNGGYGSHRECAEAQAREEAAPSIHPDAYWESDVGGADQDEEEHGGYRPLATRPAPTAVRRSPSTRTPGMTTR